MTKIIFSTVFLAFMITVNFAQQKEKKDSLKYEIDEVVIIGTRAVEKIVDIPYSVFKVDKKELSFGKKISAKDVLADVPGLFLQSRYGNHDLRVSMRGFGTRSNSGIRGVRVLQDGIPESEPDGETILDAIDLNSLGGVEVVKGNLSSLYANAPGGVINFVTDMDFPTNYFASMNQFGKFGYRQNGFRLGLKDHSNRFLLTYNYRNFLGYREHSNEYQHLVNSIYEAFYGKSVLSVLGNFVNGVNKLPGGLTKEEYDKDPMAADPIAVSQDFRRVTKKGRVALRYRTSFEQYGSNEVEVTGYAGIKELEKTDNELYTYSTRYNLGALLRISNTSEIFNRKNVLSAGMDYAFQSGPFTEFNNLLGFRDISVQNEYNPSLSNIGFYFLDHLNLIENKFDLFISGRYDKYIYNKEVFIPFGITDTSRVMQNFSPKIALNYKLFPQIALYTSYGLSYDYPAISELSNSPFSSNIKYSLNPDLNPQRSNNFEIGIKGNILNPGSDFMRKLFFEVTFFNYIIKDEIVPFVIALRPYFRNAAKTNRTGVEVGFKSEPFEEIELTINYCYTNFKYESYSAKKFQPGGIIEEIYDGNIVPSIPKHILNFILNYELEISEEISGLLQWDMDYIDKMYANDANTEMINGYFYANIMAGFNFSFEKFNIITYAGIGNIFDKRYVGFITVNDFYNRYRETGEPRNIHGGLNISYKF